MPRFVQKVLDSLESVGAVRRYTLEEIAQRVAMTKGMSFQAVYDGLSGIMEGASCDCA